MPVLSLNFHKRSTVPHNKLRLLLFNNGMKVFIPFDDRYVESTVRCESDFDIDLVPYELEYLRVTNAARSNTQRGTNTPQQIPQEISLPPACVPTN